MPVDFGADEVRFDARRQALEVAGHVRVDEPPFYLMSDELRLHRVSIGVVLDGEGKVVFCPCLGSPLAVRFHGATIAPPHDLVLRQPVLEVFGVPVAWAPLFWLRSPGRLGVLPPEVAWRGADGLFVGEGVHVPWVNGDRARGLDLRAGGYIDGGADVDATLMTSQTRTRVKWDLLKDQAGVAVDARGATAPASDADPAHAPPVAVAWSVDALRGARAVYATTDLDVAARPFDRADAQAAWRAEGWTWAAGVRSTDLRGGPLGDFGAGGPVVAAHRGDAIGHVGAYDASFEGGAVSGAGAGTLTFARAEGGALLATHLGALGGSLALRGLGGVADDGFRVGLDGAAQARAAIGLPLVRAFGDAAAPGEAKETGAGEGTPNDPWVHRTEPRAEAAVLAAHDSGVIAVPAGRGMEAPSGMAWVATAGWLNALGRWAQRTSIEADVAGGAVGGAGDARLAVRARAAANLAWLGLRADFARVLLGPSGVAGGADTGGAVVARARIGPERGLNLAAHVAGRDRVDPVVARALVDAPLEPASGFLAAPGWTGGARLALPLGSHVTTRAGADVDVDARELVAWLGAIELHDPCSCVILRASAAHRVGRAGVDAWVTVDVPR
jgi:hypothetical protein